MEGGYTGLFDQRRGKRSIHRVPMETRVYWGCTATSTPDFNVRHFHEKLRDVEGIRLSYSWVKQALQGTGLVSRKKKRGPHRRRRPRRPLPGMLLLIDGSKHRWFQDVRYYDLIVILDDATSEIERKGLFCVLYFFVTPKTGAPVDKSRLTQVGRALKELGVQMIPAYSPQARGRSERCFGTWQSYLDEFDAGFTVKAVERGTGPPPLRAQRPELDLLDGGQGQHGGDPEPMVAARQGRDRLDPLRTARGGPDN